MSESQLHHHREVSDHDTGTAPRNDRGGASSEGSRMPRPPPHNAFQVSCATRPSSSAARNCLGHTQLNNLMPSGNSFFISSIFAPLPLEIEMAVGALHLDTGNRDRRLVVHNETRPCTAQRLIQSAANSFWKQDFFPNFAPDFTMIPPRIPPVDQAPPGV